MVKNPQDLNTAMMYADNADNVIWFSGAIYNYNGGGGPRRLLC